MTWAYNTNTFNFLDQDGPIGSTFIIAPGSTSVAFEGSEGYIGKAWGSATPTSETTDIEGSAATSSGGAQYDLGAGGTIDLTSTLFSFWFLYTAKTGETLEDADSIQCRVADSGETSTQTNYYRYDLTGAVTPGAFYAEANKGFNSFVVGGANRGTQVGTATDLTDIRWVTVWLEWSSANSGGQEPSFAFDWWKSGDTYTATNGTSSVPETLEGLRSFDAGDVSNRFTDPDYGLVQGQNIFYEPWAKINIGNGTTSTYVAVEDSFIFLNPYAEEVPYDWTVTNNATLRWGRLDQQAQEDYPVGGITIASPDEVYISSIAIENGATFEMYGSRVYRQNDFLLGEAAAGTDPTIDIRASDVDTVRNVEFRSTNADIVDTDFHDPLPTFLNAAAAYQDDNGSYTAVTTNWNNDTTATAIFPASEVVDQDGHIFGFGEQFSAVEFEISTAGVGGAVTFQYWNGTAWTDLANVVDGTSSFTATASAGAYDRYRVTWDLPTDWATRQLVAEGQQYYVRANIDTVYSTNPQIQQGRIAQRRIGILVDAPNSLTNCRFFKADRAVYFQASVTVTGYNATDNAYDAVIDNLLTVTLVNSRFNPDKLLQV